MEVFKFGGASLANANNFKNVAAIIKSAIKKEQSLVVVASALGKSTNKLEAVWADYYKGKKAFTKSLQNFQQTYQDLINQLISEKKVLVSDKVKNLFLNVQVNLLKQKYNNRNFTYDAIVSLGELATTTILSAYLQQLGVKNTWLDARQLIVTDHRYRSARVDFKLTNQQIKRQVKKGQLYITQGFLGGTDIATTTTLGREGSDYSAAIFANALKANQLSIWKDVEGVLTADPKLMPNATLIKNMTYDEAINLTYFGAKVIHPKTLSPLQKANIPLRVRSFINKKNKGTLISQKSSKGLPPYYIFKENQLLIHCDTTQEFGVSEILQLFKKHDLPIAYINLSSQNLSLVCDALQHKTKLIMKTLGKQVLQTKKVNAHVFYKQPKSFINARVGGSKIIGSNQKGDFWVVVV